MMIYEILRTHNLIPSVLPVITLIMTIGPGCFLYKFMRNYPYPDIWQKKRLFGGASNMPGPMIHLTLANRLNEQFGFPDNGLFYLGSIAPDAIHMRAQTARLEKRAVHFMNDEGLRFDALKNFVSTLGMQQVLSPFADGYAAHVLADRMWLEQVIQPIRARTPSDLSHEELRRFYYRETDSLEIFLYNTEKWRARVCLLLKDTEAPDAADILSSQEVGLWRDRVLRWPEENQDKGSYESTHYTQDVLQSFISRATEEIADAIFSWRPE